DALLSRSRIGERYGDLRITVPQAVVLATDLFEEFLERNSLRDLALESADEREIERRFVAADLPPAAERDLATFAAATAYPLAVRSSSLVEDSQYQPFAGIYATFMLPNDHGRTDVRLRQLLTAIKRVYASTFSRAAKAYLTESPYRLEEEKMAVVLQRIVGGRHGRRFYPDVAGVARSHNFYPLPPMKSEDGLAAVALGLGETVVTGGTCVRFSPRYPRHVVQFSTVGDILANAQRDFFALELGGDSATPFAPVRFDLADAEQDGTLAWVGSTYSPENDVVYDGISRPGVRVVTFAPILKHALFPLAPLLDALLRMATAGTSTPVELEFAAHLSSTATPECGIL